MKREIDFASEHSNDESVQYSTVARIFGNFRCTVTFQRNSHLGFYPQPAFVLDRPKLQRRRRTPDSAGVLLTSNDDNTVSARLYWWCEEKPSAKLETFRSTVKEHVVVVEPSASNRTEIRSLAVQEMIKQLNMQARYAFAHYRSAAQPPGFFAFLVIGATFSLFYYTRPKEWNLLMSKDPQALPHIELRPKVILFNEDMLDEASEGFSPQMLYAFELLRLAVDPAVIQPSFYQPLETLFIRDIKFNSTVSCEPIFHTDDGSELIS